MYEGINFTPPTAGARKSVVHPNQTDVVVLNAVLQLASTEVRTADVVQATGLDKAEVSRSVKWLVASERLTANGKGRGTSYAATVTENDLVPVDPETLGEDYRNPGGPTVNEIVRAVFNTLQPDERVSPSEVMQRALVLFPEKRLTRSSFGQIFSKMARSGELSFEGKGRSSVYWRGTDLLPGAAEVETAQVEVQDVVAL